MMDSLCLFGVIALPAIAPLIALIQLLFPGLLGDHWKQYRAAIGVLLSQSTLMFAHWVLVTWVYQEPSWWLSPAALAWAMAGVALIGFGLSLAWRRESPDSAPARIEKIALAGLLLASMAWLTYRWLAGGSLIDQMFIVACGCFAALIHLKLRHAWSSAGRMAAFATESIFLLTLALTGSAVAQLISSDVAARQAVSSVSGEWTTFRADPARTGSSDIADAGPTRPAILWEFPPPMKIGDVFLDSSPVVVDGLVFLGVRHEVSALNTGHIYCVNARTGRLVDGMPRKAGDAVWSYTHDSLRPVFSSAAVSGGYVFLGEGYHQHAQCRLFCIDATNGHAVWSFRTSSHVESPPTIVEGRIYFGAGDDGTYCLNLSAKPGAGPTIAWHYKTVHVDSAPLVVDGKAFIGGVVGDVVANLKVVALDATTGQKLWEKPSELPIPSSPSYGDGGVFFGLGNGKFNAENPNPRGAVWRLAAGDGTKEWEFPLESSVLAPPIALDGRVYFVARNGECYALDAASGQRVWKQAVGEDVLGSPIVSGGQMFVVTASGVIHCLDARTGKPLWEFDKLRQASVAAYSSPALVDGRLYVAIGGKLHCVGNAE